MSFLLNLAWRDLRASGRSLWVFCACLFLGVALVAATGGLYQLINQSLLADTRALREHCWVVIWKLIRTIRYRKTFWPGWLNAAMCRWSPNSTQCWVR